MTASIQQNVISRSRRGAFSSHRTFSQKGIFTQQSLSIGLSLLVLVSLSMLAFFYLQQVLQTSSRGSDIHALENTLIELKEKHRSLELQSAELRSIQAIEEHVENLNLVSTDRVSYLGGALDHVAVNAR